MADPVLEDWTGQVRGLTFGDVASGYPFAGPVEGMGAPAYRTADLELASSDGDIAAASDRYGPRVLTWPLTVLGDSPADLAARLAALKAAFARAAGDLELYLNLPGGPYVLIGRPRGLEVDLELAPSSTALALATFVALDPALYGAERTGTTALADVSGGLTFPATPNFVFGAAGVSGTIAATNDGDLPSYPSAIIYGGANGVDDPRIENVTTGESLIFDGLTIAAGDYLEVRFHPRDRAVLLNGTASRYSNKRPSSTFFALAPGVNEVRYAANTALTGSSLELVWRSAST